MPHASPSFQQRMLKWYDQVRRSMPWRAPKGQRPDPYHVLVSETMLQQTQVVTAIPYFERFITEFPTIQALARASEQQVLRVWQGLGYYRRARYIRHAAQRIVADHNGQIPQEVAALMKLPGIGRYTAGAIRSLAFDLPAPILDGNVTRVLCRLNNIRADPRRPAVQRDLWQKAEKILPARRIGDFNSALMELGATLCTPTAPQCERCPVKDQCAALAAGTQAQIPPTRPRRALTVERRTVLCICHDGRYLLQQRPATGRWAGMWQFITRCEPPHHRTSVPAMTHAPPSTPARSPRPFLRFEHVLTHRRYYFKAYWTSVDQPPDDMTGIWVRLDELGQYPLPRPHQRIAAALVSRIDHDPGKAADGHQSARRDPSA